METVDIFSFVNTLINGQYDTKYRDRDDMRIPATHLFS